MVESSSCLVKRTLKDFRPRIESCVAGGHGGSCGMAYVDRVLQPGEQVIHRARLHWLIYGRAVLLLAAAAALALLAVPASDDLRSALDYAGLAVLALAVIAALAAAIRRSTTELVVTNQRVIFKRGVVSRHTVEMNRGKIESVDVDQSLLGRLLGYGTVVVHGTGGSLEPLANIEAPLLLRSRITVA
jgi:uncharacterized membrane protein YdbT with pleckstrin-like domain